MYLTTLLVGVLNKLVSTEKKWVRIRALGQAPE